MVRGADVESKRAQLLPSGDRAGHHMVRARASTCRMVRGPEGPLIERKRVTYWSIVRFMASCRQPGPRAHDLPERARHVSSFFRRA